MEWQSDSSGDYQRLWGPGSHCLDRISCRAYAGCMERNCCSLIVSYCSLLLDTICLGVNDQQWISYKRCTMPWFGSVPAVERSNQMRRDATHYRFNNVPTFMCFTSWPHWSNNINTPTRERPKLSLLQNLWPMVNFAVNSCSGVQLSCQHRYEWLALCVGKAISLAHPQFAWEITVTLEHEMVGIIEMISTDLSLTILKGLVNRES